MRIEHFEHGIPHLRSSYCLLVFFHVQFKVLHEPHTWGTTSTCVCPVKIAPTISSGTVSNFSIQVSENGFSFGFLKVCSCFMEWVFRILKEHPKTDVFAARVGWTTDKVAWGGSALFFASCCIIYLPLFSSEASVNCVGPLGKQCYRCA